MDTSYFDQVDTPEKSYWLGFISADGYVVNDEARSAWRVGIELATIDRAHLVSFQKAIGRKEPPWDRVRFTCGGWRSYSGILVSSRRMVDALASHGVMPRKTFTGRPWTGPEELMPHYWRGVIDGDGCITRSNGPVKSPAINVKLVGNLNICDAFASYVNGAVGTNVHATARSSNLHQVQVGGSIRVRELLRLLYGDAPVALARKRVLADKYMIKGGV